MKELLLNVQNLHTSFFTDAGEVKAVRGVSFAIEKGKSLGLVGESGCGKTVTALSIIRLLSFPGRIINGEVIYKENNLLKICESEMQKIRGKEISFIFQEPMTSLNPVFTIGEQIKEAIVLHQNLKSKEATEKVINLLANVGISDSEKRIKDYPHQLSGGMRQRVMIAMALSCNPSLLIADEPTTSLDVTIQAQILDLIKKLQQKMNMAMILITHDLGIVAETVDNVAVMYSGKIVESTSTKTLFVEPLHPYTIGLLESIPKIEHGEKKPLKTIKGGVPNLINLPKGCSFYERCPKAFSKCKESEPQLLEVKAGHRVACGKYTNLYELHTNGHE